MNRQVEANLSMVVSKALGGLNMNALKYLLPLWIAPVTGVTFRLVFGAAAFWLIDIFCKPENSTIRQKWQLFILGALGIYGYMFFYLLGISKTTPVSSSIFVSLEPIWVFIISVLFYKEKVTWMKVLGIGMGLGGAVLCISTQPSDDLASNAPLGNLMCLASSLVYAVYLVFSNRLLKGVGDMTMLKYTFLGAAVMAVVVNTIYGFDAPILKMSLFSTPMLVLLFVLVFPTTISLFITSSRAEISENDISSHLRVFNIDCCYGDFFCFGAGSLLMDTVGGDCSYLCQCLSGGSSREQ